VVNTLARQPCNSPPGIVNRVELPGMVFDFGRAARLQTSM